MRHNGSSPEHKKGQKDGSKNIVKIACTSAGERAEALQPLGAQKLRYQALLFGNVRADGEDRLGNAVIVPDNGRARMDVERFSCARAS
jgi:hypothetical protein